MDLREKVVESCEDQVKVVDAEKFTLRTIRGGQYKLLRFLLAGSVSQRSPYRRALAAMIRRRIDKMITRCLGRRGIRTGINIHFNVFA